MTRFQTVDRLTRGLGLLALLLGSGSCGRPVTLEHKPCPCLPGFVCCANRCMAAGSCPVVDPNRSDAGADGSDAVKLPAPLGGQLLHAGVFVESPQLQDLGGETWVEFLVRRAPPSPDGLRGGLVDLHAVKWAAPTAHRLLIAGAADRAEWPRVEDGSGNRLVMTDERQEGKRAVGTLNRVGPTGILEQIEDVISYSLDRTTQLLHYRRLVAGAALPELHLRDRTGQDRNLGPHEDGGQVQLVGDTLYYLAGSDRTLTQVPVAGAAKAVRANVVRFVLTRDARQIIALVNDMATPRVVLLDLVLGSERAVSGASLCCWSEVRPSTFAFAEPAQGKRPATLHEVNLDTLADRVVELPPQLVDVRQIVSHPAQPRLILIDSQGQVFSYQPEGIPVFQPLPFRSPTIRLSSDGRHLVFVVIDNTADPAASGIPTGQLFAQDLDVPTRPPRLLSPLGTHVPLNNGFLLRQGEYPLVFWVRSGAGHDLYLGDHRTGASQRIAEGIGAVTFSETALFGIVRLNDDLTGELVSRNLLTNRDAFSEPDVADFAISPAGLAYVVREKDPTAARNGLWIAAVPATLR